MPLNNLLPLFLGGFNGFLLGLFRQFLTGRLFQRSNKLLLVLERADVVLLLGVDQGRALERLVIDAGFQLVEQVDHVLLGHVEGDALGFGHLLQLDHGEVMQPAARRNLLELVRQLLRLLEGRLFLRQELDQVILGAEQADLMFLELGIESGSGDSGVVHTRLRRVEQMDEVAFGPGDGDAVLLGQGLELLHAQSVQVGDLSAFEGGLELRLLGGLGFRLLFDGLGRDDARGGFSRGFGQARDLVSGCGTRSCR